MPVEHERLQRVGPGEETRSRIARIGREVDTVVGKILEECGAHAMLDRVPRKRELGCHQRFTRNVRCARGRRRRRCRAAERDQHASNGQTERRG